MERQTETHHRPDAGRAAVSDLAAEAITLAWRTRFYRRRWHRAPTGSGPPTLGSVPVTTPAAWEQAVRRNPGDVLTDVPALWTRTRQADRDLWFPIGHRDLPRAVAHAEAALRRVGVNDGTRMLAVLPPAPSMWNALPYLLLESNLTVEVLPLSLETVTYKPSLAAFPLARQPDVFLASRVLAAELARLAGSLPTWRRTILYLDGGPPLFDERLLALPGCCAPIARCDAAGWHVPRDAGVAEIHPDGFDAGAPPVRPVAGAAEHERGVLVFTAFSSVAPVVRFATGLTIRAAGPHPCPCGDPAPRFFLDGSPDGSPRSPA